VSSSHVRGTARALGLERALPHAAAHRVTLRPTQEGRTPWPTSKQQSDADVTIANSANARRRRAPVIPRRRKRNRRAGATRRLRIETARTRAGAANPREVRLRAGGLGRRAVLSNDARPPPPSIDAPECETRRCSDTDRPRSRSRLPQGCVASSRLARIGVEPLSGRDCWPQGQPRLHPTLNRVGASEFRSLPPRARVLDQDAEHEPGRSRDGDKND
jgi:hypothetical protein